jgi:hypothetical protein
MNIVVPSCGWPEARSPPRDNDGGGLIEGGNHLKNLELQNRLGEGDYCFQNECLEIVCMELYHWLRKEGRKPGITYKTLFFK